MTASAEYRRGYLDAGSQIMERLDRSTAPANLAAPIGAEPIVAEHLLAMVANEHPDADVSPLPMAVRDMAESLVKIRELLALERAADRIVDVLTSPVSPVEGTDDGHDEVAHLTEALGDLCGRLWRLPAEQRDLVLGDLPEGFRYPPAAPVVGSDDEPDCWRIESTEGKLLGWQGFEPAEDERQRFGAVVPLYRRPAPVGQTVTDAMADAGAVELWGDPADPKSGLAQHIGWRRQHRREEMRRVLEAALAVGPAPTPAVADDPVSGVYEIPDDLLERLEGAAPEGYALVEALGWVLDERDAMRVPCPDGPAPATTPEEGRAETATGVDAVLPAEGEQRDARIRQALRLGGFNETEQNWELAEQFYGAFREATSPASPEPKGGA